MILEQAFPEPETDIPIDSENLGSYYPKVEGLRFNFVISSGTDIGTSSDKSTNKLDRQLLKFIRSQSDLIITTGKTARSENLSASKHAPLLILTRSSEELDIPAVQPNEGKPVFITQRLGTLYPSGKAIAIGGVQEELPTFIESFLRANNFRYPVLETGIETSKFFASAGTIKEVNLTVTEFSNRVDAEVAAREFLADIGVKAELTQLLKSEDTWLFRFRVSQAIG